MLPACLGKGRLGSGGQIFYPWPPPPKGGVAEGLEKLSAFLIMIIHF